MINETIEDLLKEIDQMKAKTVHDVEEIRVKLLGKKGSVTKLFDDFRQVLPEQKRELGQRLNILKTKAAEKIEELRELLNDTPEAENSKLD